MILTPAEVAAAIPDVPGSNTRHYVFARYVLGEKPNDALWIAEAMKNNPLPLHAMLHIAKRWNFPELEPL
jgi:hypothetical protein